MPVIAEERAGLGALSKDAPVTKEPDLVRVNRDRCFLPRILVVDKEPVIPVILPYGVDQAEMAATFPALAAFKGHLKPSRKYTGYYRAGS